MNPIHLKMEDQIQLPIEALRLLRERDYLWDYWTCAYRRARRPYTEPLEQYLKSEPDQITFEELTDNKLFETLDHPQKDKALRWLEQRLKKSGEPAALGAVACDVGAIPINVTTTPRRSSPRGGLTLQRGTLILLVFLFALDASLMNNGSRKQQAVAMTRGLAATASVRCGCS